MVRRKVPVVSPKVPEGEPREARESAWVALLRAHRSASASVEAALKAADLPSLAWYDVLLELKRAPEGLRAVELERRLIVAQYNVSRLLDRLEKAGLLERTPDPADARARLLFLTKRGLALQQEVWPHYARWIAQHLGKALDDAEARQLASLLNKVADQAQRQA